MKLSELKIGQKFICVGAIYEMLGKSVGSSRICVRDESGRINLLSNDKIVSPIKKEGTPTMETLEVGDEIVCTRDMEVRRITAIGNWYYLFETRDSSTDRVGWSGHLIDLVFYHKSRTIQIDGKTIELSEESFEALKSSLLEGK